MTTSATGSSSSSLFTNKQRVTGLANGSFDTQSIIQNLMSIERQPYDKLDIKRQTEQLRLQAYQAVNTYILNFRNSVSTLSSRTLWNSKTTTSTNEKSLTATANEYAVKGSYSFKVAQLATAAQFRSKGVLDSKAALSPPKKTTNAEGEEITAPAEKLGTITLASGKTRVDNSAKLEQLNGGKGVFRGSIRITDSNNGTANVDLSACVTLDDVIRTINEANGVRINATMRDGRIHIEDEAGGASSLKIQNVGAGTAATDLGIAGTSEDILDAGGAVVGKALHGRNVFTLGRDMSLAMLNDGLGVEEGNIALRIYGKDTNGDPAYAELVANIDDCKTVGDVIDRVNKEIENLRDNGFANPADNVGGVGDTAAFLKNIRFGVSSDGRSFGFTGVTQDNSFVFYDLNNANMVGQTTPAAQLGLATGEPWTVAQNAREISFGRVLGDANSPMLKNLGGVGGQGVGSYPSGSMLPVAFDENTKISALNGGRGLDTTTGFQFILLEGGRDSSGVDASAEKNIISDVIDMGAFRTWLEEDADGDSTNGVQERTLGQLVAYLNEKISEYAADPDNGAAGLAGMKFTLDAASESLVIDGVQPGYSVQIAGGLAGSLNLTRARGAGTAVGSALELDPSREEDAALRDAVDQFYGTGDHGKNIRAPGSNDDIVLSGEDATKLGDLGIDWATVFGAGEGVTIRLANGKNASGTLAYDYGDGTASDWGDPLAVTVKWEDLRDENGDPIAIGADTDLGVLVDAMNKALENGFRNATGGGQPYTYEGHVPQLRVNAVANGLQWSNMDFAGNYWEMADAGTAGGLAEMNLARDFASTTPLAETAQAPSYSGKKLAPRAVAYVEAIEISAESAARVKMGELNFGTGITLAGDENVTFDIEFKPNTAADGEDYNGKSVSFTMKELQDAVQAKLDAWNADPANADDAKKKHSANDLTIDEYMEVLNGLVDEKIADYYATEEPNVAEDDRFSMQFKVSDGVFVAADIRNADGLKIAGTALNDLYGTRTGIAPILYTQKQLDEFEKNGTEVVVNYAGNFAGKIHEQEIQGLGEIFFTLDSDDRDAAVFKLSTEGLDQNSTLNDLINKLNDELAGLAATDSRLKDVRFKLNDSGTGIAVSNGSNARITFIDSYALKDPAGDADDPANRLSDAQRLAQDLGLVGANGESKTVEAYSQANQTTLNRHYVSRATPLETFLGKGVENGSITLTNAGGHSVSIDLAAAKTLGDVIDAINSQKGFGVKAELNEAGDGIRIYEDYDGNDPDPALRTGQISVSDVEGGSNIAKKLGIAGTGKRENGAGYSVLSGSLSTKIDVMSTDSLEDLMYRISEAGYKTAVINDGNFWRLTVSATNTGEAHDFVIDSDVEQLGFTQSYRGADAKVLQGDPNSTSSPLMLSSATNSNSNAINGLTLDIKAISNEWTTITIDDDKEAVAEAVKTMVTSYNELSEIIKMLDAYDTETGEEGILFGDDNVRGLMDDISEFFYQVYNPNNAALGELDDDGKQQTWTWMDLGINLSAQPSNADGTGGWYNQIDLDEDKLTEMVSSNWDVLSKMLWNEQNVSNVNANSDAKVRPTASFNGDLEDGFGVDGALNGNLSKSAFGPANGIQAKDTIANGDDEYTIWFQKSTLVNRMTVYFPSAEDSLKDFTVEYLDSATGQWKELRHSESNASDYVSFGFMTENVNASAMRLTAKETNAKDGKFRLLDVQIFEQSGLAGKMNQHTTGLGDTQNGFLASMNTEIQASLTDIEEQMQRLQDKLTAKEESLWRRFSTMETAMNKLKGQGDYFSNMMKSMGSGS